MIRSIYRTVAWISLTGFAVLTGCQSADQAHSGHMASVEIYGHTEAQIQKAAAAAFIENGYNKVGDLTFEKKGSAWETANYGGWSATTVWIRMRAEISTVDSQNYTLACDVFVVDAHGEAGMETERKFLFAKRSGCKKILDEVKAALETPPAAGTGNP